MYADYAVCKRLLIYKFHTKLNNANVNLQFCRCCVIFLTANANRNLLFYNPTTLFTDENGWFDSQIVFRKLWWYFYHLCVQPHFFTSFFLISTHRKGFLILTQTNLDKMTVSYQSYSMLSCFLGQSLHLAKKIAIK